MTTSRLKTGSAEVRTNVGRLAIVFGILLGILGVGFYIYTEMRSPTALIPVAFGAIFIVLGLLARNDRLRMHVMHAAATIGLVGVLLPIVQVSRKLATGGAVDNAVIEQIMLAMLCAAFVALCIKSFIDAGRRRRQAKQTP